MTQSSQRFCLRWNNHQSNLLSVFDQLLQDESFVDVTLAVEGQFLRAHKMVLSACSPYFQTLFVGHPDKHPIVILKDVPFADMRSLLDFMYRGEVSVDQDRLSAFLKVAESLRIKGLTEVNEDKCDTQSSLSSLISNPPSSSSAPPPPDLHRIQLSQPSHKRSSTPSSVNGATSPYSQKRKRGRPRKLSESSDGGDESPDRDCAILDSDSKQLDSSYGNGPPDLLEVNMSDHPLNTSGALSDDGNESPERVISQEQETEDFCYINNIKREIDEPSSPDNKNSSRENNVGIKSEISNHQSSERCPADNIPSERRVQSLSRWCTISKDVSIIKLDKCSSSSAMTTNRPGERDYQTGTDENGTVEKVEILPLMNDKKRSNDCVNPSSDCLPDAGNRLQFSPKVNNTVSGNNFGAAAGMHFLFNQTQIDTDEGAADGDRPSSETDKNMADESAATANEVPGGFFYKSSNSVVCKLCGEIMEWQELSGHSRVHQNAAPAVSALYKCRSCNVFFKTRRGCSGHIQSKQCSLKVNHGESVAALATDCPTAERDATGAPPVSYTDARSCKPYYKPVADDNNSVREKEEKFVADIINRVKKECELQKSRIKKCILPLRTTAASQNSGSYPAPP